MTSFLFLSFHLFFLSPFHFTQLILILFICYILTNWDRNDEERIRCPVYNTKLLNFPCSKASESSAAWLSLNLEISLSPHCLFLSNQWVRTILNEHEQLRGECQICTKPPNFHRQQRKHAFVTIWYL